MPASPLTAALMAGSGTPEAGAMFGMDPAVMQAMPELQLAQSMLQSGLSTESASPMQALARLAQTAAGGYIQRGALSDLGKAYASAPENMAQVFDATTKDPNNIVSRMLRSPDPLVRMQGMQMAQKAGLQINENNPTMAGARAGAEAQAGAPYKSGGTAVLMGPNGPTETPITAQTRANMQPGVQPAAPQPSAPRPSVPSSPTAAIPPPEPQADVRVGPALVENKDQSRLPAGAPTLASQSQIAQSKETAEGAAKDYVEKSTPAFNSAQNLLGRLDLIDHNIDALGPSWMGSGADTKAELGKAWNSTLDTMGVEGAHVDPTKIASWEDFNKETTRAGMELIKSNFGGSREAASIIQMGRTAVPSVQNTYIGAKYVSATIRAAAQREIDLHNYKTGLIKSGQSLVGADADFSAQHPPEQYAMGAITSQIPPQAVSTLKSQPGSVAAFDKHFGAGTGEFILGQKPNGGQ